VTEAEKIKDRLPELLRDAASKGKRTLDIGAALNGHDRFVWLCGKGPSQSWFSHHHKKSCLAGKYLALWDMLEREGLSVSLEYRVRPNGVVGTYTITVKVS
jgi:hypothetical protein